MTRAAISVKVQVSVAIRQANSLADPKTYKTKGVFCPLCQQILLSNEPRVLEHMVPRATRIALGEDPDAIEILAWVHKACADLKTYGRKATCADGDIHKIAKAKRIAKKLSGQDAKPKRRIQGRAFPLRGRTSWPETSLPLPSRGFQKRYKPNEAAE